METSGGGYNIATTHVYFTHRPRQISKLPIFRGGGGALSKLRRCKKIRTVQLNLSLNHIRYRSSGDVWGRV